MPELRSDVRFTMPCAMVMHLPFAEQLTAVQAAGFQELTLHPFFMTDVNRAGVSFADMRSMVSDAGLRIDRIDPLTTWVPEWKAWNFGDEYNVQVSMEQSLFFELSEFLGCRYVSLNSMWKAGQYSIEQIAEYYRAVCERAQPYGLACDLEPIPMWGIPRLEDALEVLRLAGVANGGLVFDVTHFTRGGTPLEVLAEVQGELIHNVQLCDGRIPSKQSLEDECFDRMWPGTGDFDIPGILRVLDIIGGLNGVGPEVFDPAYIRDRTPGEVIAQRTVECLTRYPELAARVS